MKCYVHHEEEAVATCAKCGVAMCHACEKKALFRTANGTGQAMCPRCSLNEAQSIVDYESKWLKKRAIKLGFCSLFIVWGLIEYFGRLQVQIEQDLSSNYISGIHLIKKSVEQFIRSVVA